MNDNIRSNYNILEQIFKDCVVSKSGQEFTDKSFYTDNFSSKVPRSIENFQMLLFIDQQNTKKQKNLSKYVQKLLHFINMETKSETHQN